VAFVLLFVCVLASATRGYANPEFPRSTASLVGGVAPVVVALDPGHGGSNLGAAFRRGEGVVVYEKKVTLLLAERIRTLLQSGASPEITVVLCREADVLVPIRARARCARDSGARAFISLHANAVPVGVRPGSQRGYEVFVLGPREVEDDATLASLTPGSRRGDNAEGVWAAYEVRAAAEQSIGLARAILDALKKARGADASRGVKQSGAALDVLRGTGTAAALVEVGFLDDPEEGARLTTDEGREPIAQAIASAVRNYVTRGQAHATGETSAGPHHGPHP